MKTQSQNMFESVNAAEMENLTSQVAETVAKKANQNAVNFSSAQLWNIHRQRKTLVIR